MKQTVLISIIIPVYNAEEFIGMMLDSVQNQTYGMLDIILVNDGSTDGTKNVCMPYLEKDKRFQYYEQQNRGPSAARNFGLRKAKGDYILFVDASNRTICGLRDGNRGGHYCRMFWRSDGGE